jgi:hypothetical protein
VTREIRVQMYHEASHRNPEWRLECRAEFRVEMYHVASRGHPVDVVMICGISIVDVCKYGPVWTLNYIM